MMRLPFVTRIDFQPEEQGLFDDLEARGGTIHPLYAMMANAPTATRSALDVTQTIRQSAELPANLRELAVLRTVTLNGTEYLAVRHASKAQTNGIDAAQLQDLERFERSDRFSEAEKAAIQLANDLHSPPFIVSNATWTTLSETLSPRGLAELVICIGMYHMASRFVGAVEVKDDA